MRNKIIKRIISYLRLKGRILVDIQERGLGPKD